jgi:hypothetical protein
VAEAVKAQLEKIKSRRGDILEIKEELEHKWQNLVAPGEDGRYTFDQKSELENAAKAYFTQSESTIAKFPQIAPVRGSKDWQKVTYLLGLLQRAASLPSVAPA